MADYIKDPDAVLDYGVDWSPWLETGETISTSEWTASPDGLTVMDEPAPGMSGTSTLVWLSGGVAGRTYRVTNRITTTAGRIDERSIEIRVRER